MSASVRAAVLLRLSWLCPVNGTAGITILLWLPIIINIYVSLFCVIVSADRLLWSMIVTNQGSIVFFACLDSIS